MPLFCWLLWWPLHRVSFLPQTSFHSQELKCLSLIEGTFADVWSVEITLAYYSVLTASSFIGAATGNKLHLDHNFDMH